MSAVEARQSLASRAAPIARANHLAERALFARLHQMRDAGEICSIAPSSRAKPSRLFGNRWLSAMMRGVEADRQIEHVADRTAFDRIERRDRNPFDLVEQAELLEDRVFGFAGIMRIGRLMQRRLDRQRALLEGRSGPADAVIAFDHADLAPRLGEQRRRGKAAETGADDDGVESCFAHWNPLCRRTRETL